VDKLFEVLRASIEFAWLSDFGERRRRRERCDWWRRDCWLELGDLRLQLSYKVLELLKLLGSWSSHRRRDGWNDGGGCTSSRGRRWTRDARTSKWRGEARSRGAEGRTRGTGGRRGRNGCEEKENIILVNANRNRELYFSVTGDWKEVPMRFREKVV
jgi:hypothetical protein